MGQRVREIFQNLTKFDKLCKKWYNKKVVDKGGICFMQKISKGKLKAIKLICTILILILLSGFGVMTVATNLNSVKIELSNGYELTVLTSKTNVDEILNDNNIIVKEDENVSPSVEGAISSDKTIKISKKSEQEIEVAKVSESGVDATLDSLLEAYSNIIEKIEVIEESIPFETVTKDVSDGAESTRNQVVQQGKEGLKRVTYKVKYKDDTEIERTQISEEILEEPVNKIVQVKSNVVSSRSETPVRGAVTGSVAEYQAYAKQRVYDYGWSDADFNALVNLWNRESGWSVTNRNRSSGAYGIPQALPASKMSSAGSDYLTNYKTQINWGLSYIKSRYGSPSNAWNSFKAKGWY